MSIIAISSATSRFGALVLRELQSTVPAARLRAIVRDKGKAAGLAASGVPVLEAPHGEPDAWDRALRGVNKLLLIASSEFGQMTLHHRVVLEAAKRAGVELVVYTSLLHADCTALSMGSEHLQTEDLLRALGIPFIILRNGWFHENYTIAIRPALAYGDLLGCAGGGLISSAARADYASAAVAALCGRVPTGAVYELAGDQAYTLPQLAAEISKQAGRRISYINLPESEFVSALVSARMPREQATAIASWDAAAAKGALFDDGYQLTHLLGRPTTPVSEAVREALRGLKT